MLLSLLVYGYATGNFSSRKIERATYDSLAFRYLAAGSRPDHDTLASFRRRFLDELAGIFLQVLELAGEMKLLKLGTVSLDGTKLHVNASRHSALSHGHLQVIEGQLKAQVQELLALAESADQADLPDGINLPEEIKRRQDRLAAMDIAKVKIEARARVRFEQEQAAYQAKLDQRAAATKLTGKQPGGRPPLGGALQVDRVPQHYCGGHQVEAAGTVALLFEAPIPDFTEAVEEHRPGQGIACLALVQPSMHSTTQLNAWIGHRKTQRRSERYPE